MAFRSIRLSCALICTLAFLSSCGPVDPTPTDLPSCGDAPPQEGVAALRAAVIYGRDDRKEVFVEPDRALRARATRTVVAMIRANRLDTSDPDNVRFRNPGTLEREYGMCSYERFSNQPPIAECSGVLIDHDLVMTAGHCVDGPNACRDFRFVFGYNNRGPGELAPITSDQIFECDPNVPIEVRENFDIPGIDARRDFAIVRLTRVATPQFTPALLPTGSAPVSANQRVVIIGFPLGIPAKIDEGGRVLSVGSVEQGWFRLSTDTFGGNSGSGIFTASDSGTPTLVGILKGGAQDFVRDETCDCLRSNVIEEGTSQGELGIYSTYPRQVFCDRGFRATFCGDPPPGPPPAPDPECGDGLCNGTETTNTCARDCPAEPPPVPAGWTCAAEAFADGGTCDCGCGEVDPDCNGSETTTLGCSSGDTCAPDGMCRNAPPSWMCETTYWRTLDGCDCNCGAYDPDCAQPDQELFDCEDGQVCTPRGTCG